MIDLSGHTNQLLLDRDALKDRLAAVERERDLYKELVKAKDMLLSAYRLGGNHNLADKALDKIYKIKAALRKAAKYQRITKENENEK